MAPVQETGIYRTGTCVRGGRGFLVSTAGGDSQRFDQGTSLWQPRVWWSSVLNAILSHPMTRQCDARGTVLISIQELQAAMRRHPGKIAV